MFGPFAKNMCQEPRDVGGAFLFVRRSSLIEMLKFKARAHSKRRREQTPRFHKKYFGSLIPSPSLLRPVKGSDPSEECSIFDHQCGRVQAGARADTAACRWRFLLKNRCLK